MTIDEVLELLRKEVPKDKVNELAARLIANLKCEQNIQDNNWIRGYACDRVFGHSEAHSYSYPGSDGNYIQVVWK